MKLQLTKQRKSVFKLPIRSTTSEEKRRTLNFAGKTCISLIRCTDREKQTTVLQSILSKTGNKVHLARIFHPWREHYSDSPCLEARSKKASARDVSDNPFLRVCHCLDFSHHFHLSTIDRPFPLEQARLLRKLPLPRTFPTKRTSHYDERFQQPPRREWAREKPANQLL